MIPNYPELCIQAGCPAWWLEDAGKPQPCRGRLVKAYLPHVSQVPMALVPRGRAEDDRQHQLADCEIVPLDHKAVMEPDGLPVAGIPCPPREARGVYLVKKRPAVILAMPGEELPKGLVLGKPRGQTLPTFIVAPYYGADENTGTRAGYSDAFLDRVRKLEYPRFFWEKLPLSGSTVSVLRVDHIQPLGSNHTSWELTPYRLSEEAMVILNEQIQWHFTGELGDPENSVLAGLIEYLVE